MSVAGEASPATPFGDRLAAAVEERRSQVVLGLDPDPVRLWPRPVEEAAAFRAAWSAALGNAERMAVHGLRGAEADAAAAHPGATPPSLPGEATAGRRTYRSSSGISPTADDAPPRPAAAHDASPGLAAADDAPPGLAAAEDAPPRLAAAADVLGHCLAVIDAAGPACVAVKPQLACFERLGFAGWLALEQTCAHARRAGLLVLADGKRGDVPVTASAYGQALLGATPTAYGPAPGLGADAVTANPLLGGDALAPLIEAARAGGAGVFALVRTSNPGAADVFDLPLADGRPLWERLAAAVHDAGAPGPASGLSDVGAVCGATVPAHLTRMRELMPHTPFLLPGIGAQGGDVATLAAAVAPGRAAALVTASRSIVDAHRTAGGDPAQAARAEAERLRAAAWALG